MRSVERFIMRYFEAREVKIRPKPSKTHIGVTLSELKRIGLIKMGKIVKLMRNECRDDRSFSVKNL